MISAESMFSKTALNWANENNNTAMVFELLKLENKVHANMVDGLECLRENVSSEKLLPWIIQTYKAYYPTSRKGKACGITVGFILFSFLPYLNDFYSDGLLAQSYWKIAQGNFSETSGHCVDEDHHNETNKWEFPGYQQKFNDAFFVTIVTMIITLSISACIVMCQSTQNWARKETMKNWLSKKQIDNPWIQIIANILCGILWIVAKLLWPIVLLVQKCRFNAADKKSKFKTGTRESDDTWNMIKTVDIGIENTVQLCLQIWLLKPFMPEVINLGLYNLTNKCLNGFIHFITMGFLPACYLDKALGKIFQTVIFLALGVSFVKTTKSGTGAFDSCDTQLVGLICLFISVLAQTCARLLALISLTIMDAEPEIKFLPFLVIHLILVVVIKKLFETKKSANKYEMSSIKFLLCAICSTFIMVHLHEETSAYRRQPYTFLSHTAFFCVILLGKPLISR